MKRLLLGLLFCLDVRVKAGEVTAEAAGCWGKTIPCPVQSEGAKTVIEAPSLKIALGPQALLEQRDRQTIQLVSGDFYVETAKDVTFKTPYARIWCEGECKAIFVRTTDKIDIKSLAGQWIIERNGEEQKYTVKAGLQLALSEVGEDGKAAMEFPQSLPWSPTVKQWAALYPGTLDELKPTLVKFREIWREAVGSVSDLHYQAAERNIASYEEEQAKERAAKAAREREDQRLRQLFREKNP